MTEPVAEFRDETLFLKGDWRRVSLTPIVARLPHAFDVDLGELGEWDSTLPAYLWALRRRYGRELKLRNIPGPARNIEKLLAIAESAVAHKKIEKVPVYLGPFERAACWFEHLCAALKSAVEFLGEIFLAWGAFVAHKTHFRLNDWLKEFNDVGWKALPIVSLISFLVGLIVAFVSAVQLNRFGAIVYVSDLVGLSMTREMGALMTAIIMAGRTGAAYAAQIGSMKRSEELDALRTMGLNPIEMVVLPKVVALTVMIPLLSVFSMFLGIFGGMVICSVFFELAPSQYLDEMAGFVAPKQFIIGVVKAMVYGFLVAFAGAWRGVRCGDSADAVGKAATSAVVMGITLIVVANAIFAILLNALNL
jgi:phospholipid/cholesterol/gamma-HCH transport system permease protein